MINNVSHKIEKIEHDLSCIGSDYKSSVEGQAYLGVKQQELMGLRREHEQLVKNIRDYSGKRRK